MLYISTYASAVRHARALWNCHERRHVTSVRVQISRHKQGVSPVLGIRKDAKVLLRISKDAKIQLGMSADARVRLGISKAA